MTTIHETNSYPSFAFSFIQTESLAQRPVVLFHAPTGNAPAISATVTTLTSAATVNLSSYDDWTDWGGPNDNCTTGPCLTNFAAGGKAISGIYTTVPAGQDSNVYGGITDTLLMFSYSNGANGASGTSQLARHINSHGDLSFVVPADNSVVRGLDFWLIQNTSTTQNVVFTLSDGSVAPRTLSTVIDASGGRQHMKYHVDFAAASNGTFLKVTIPAGGFDNTWVQAAAITGALITPTTYTAFAGQNLQDLVDLAKELDTIYLPDFWSWTGHLVANQNKATTIKSSVSTASGVRVGPRRCEGAHPSGSHVRTRGDNRSRRGKKLLG